MNKSINVSGGVITRSDGKILLAQRRKGSIFELLWEFPGGKCEINETLQECLIREIDEELGIDISVGKFIDKVDFTHKDKLYSLHIFFATCQNHHHTKMNSHENIVWIDIDELQNFDIVQNDLLIIPTLKRLHQSNFQSLS